MTRLFDKDLFTKVDEIPVTLIVALTYVTVAFLTDDALHEAGNMSPVAVANGDWWRLLSNAFLHGGLLHLGLNTWAMLAIGPSLERALGSVRMFVLYMVSALGGSLLVCLIYNPQHSVVGGSGALFGLLGAIVALQMRQGRHVLAFLDYEGPRRILVLIAINLVIGIMVPFISNTAHVGGLLTGFAITFLWLAPLRARARDLTAWRTASVALLVGLLFHAMQPVTRHDWLWNQAVREQNPRRRAVLQRAAAMSYFGLDEATDNDVQALYFVLFPPAVKRGG